VFEPLLSNDGEEKTREDDNGGRTEANGEDVGEKFECIVVREWWNVEDHVTEGFVFDERVLKCIVDDFGEVHEW